MELIAISTETTWLQVILILIGVICGVFAIFNVLSVACELSDEYGKYRSSLIVTLVSVFMLLSTTLVYRKTEKYVLYHYLVKDFDKLESKLKTHEIYDSSSNIYKLIEK